MATNVWKELMDEVMNTRPADIAVKLQELEEGILAERTRLELAAKSLLAQQKVLASLRLAVVKDVPTNGKADKAAYHKSPEFREKEVFDAFKKLTETTAQATVAQVAEVLCAMKDLKVLTRRRAAIGAHLANLKNKGFLRRSKQRGYWEMAK